jgi:hypothetical protein
MREHKEKENLNVSFICRCELNAIVPDVVEAELHLDYVSEDYHSVFRSVGNINASVRVVQLSYSEKSVSIILQKTPLHKKTKTPGLSDRQSWQT